MSVKYAEIDNLCTQFSLKGKEKITTRMIRAELGCGSLSTISKHLKTWQTQFLTSQDQDNVHHLPHSKRIPEVDFEQESIRTDSTVQECTHQNDDQRKDIRSGVDWQRYISTGVLSISVCAVTWLLVSMQYSAYQKENLPFALWLSVFSEAAMILLVAIRFQGLKKIIAFFTCSGFFIYSLGLLSFDLMSDKEKEVAVLTSTQEESSSLNSSIDLTQKALALALERKESGNVAKLSKSLETLNTQSVQQGSEAFSSVHDRIHMNLTDYKFNGLIVLRALLMIFNLLLVHNLVEMWRPKAKLGA